MKWMLALLFGLWPLVLTAQPRPMPGHIYGVTVDDISDQSDITAALAAMPRFPAVRVVFDPGTGPAYYSAALTDFRPHAFIMGEPVDSSAAKQYSLSSYTTRFQNYWNHFRNTVDLWEVGNEVNGNWLGSGMPAKIQAAFDVVHGAGGATMLTFFYMGEASGTNCNDRASDDMFKWINANIANGQHEAMRLGLTQVSVSWYPDQCPGVNPDWSYVFGRLASIFPNSGVGFGEVGTPKAQLGSQHEIDLATKFYSLQGSGITLPATYSEGIFWWYWKEDAVPMGMMPFWGVIANLISNNP